MRAENDPDANFVYSQLVRHCPEIDLHGLMSTLKARARLTRLWRTFLAEWPLVLCPVSGKLPFENNIDVASSADFDAVIAAQLPQIAPPLMGLPGLALTTDLTGHAPVGVQLLADQLREDIRNFKKAQGCDRLVLVCPDHHPLAERENVLALEKELGLDKPIYTQYWNWLSEALNGRFGDSVQYQSPVSELLLPALGYSFRLAAMAFVRSIVGT